MVPKYYSYKVAGYFLYFTSKCIVEAFHVHASDGHLTEHGSAKFFVGERGQSSVMERGRISDRDIRKIQKFIESHYKEMYLLWSEFGGNGFYRGE